MLIWAEKNPRKCKIERPKKQRGNPRGFGKSHMAQRFRQDRRSLPSGLSRSTVGQEGGTHRWGLGANPSNGEKNKQKENASVTSFKKAKKKGHPMRPTERSRTGQCSHRGRRSPQSAEKCEKRTESGPSTTPRNSLKDRLEAKRSISSRIVG